ncbi:MAG TPA: RecQ family ATP-dependent DNA helicase [Puia sp.]
MYAVAFFDLEVGQENGKILDVGCIRSDEAILHKSSVNELLEFIKGMDFLCGHNIVQHDLKYLQQYTADPKFGMDKAIDTLFLSPLLFPGTPYHHLVKDDKLQTEELNNPLNDAKKARDLFFDEVIAFNKLEEAFKLILYNLLYRKIGFASFFKYIGYKKEVGSDELERTIRTLFQEKICVHSDWRTFIAEQPVPLAYALSLIRSNDRYSITPPWVLKVLPAVSRIIFLLRNRPCLQGCEYCREALNPGAALQSYFGFASFRSYGGEPLQENAVRAAIQNKSLLTIFPTGGGKSITFQLPALMSGKNAKALTVVISPLQSLMKDQVDNLEKKGITEAVTINGLLNVIDRQKAIQRVEGLEKDLALANILYISPESLRSVTIERLLQKREIARFVIDEAHCFSSWGQDFRVDYLYIGDFIKALQEKKGLSEKIPVSCFTATAKRKVIEDIRNYFKDRLETDLEIFRADASRTNLQYKIFENEYEEDKYTELRSILEKKDCPAIIYVSRTKRTHQLAKRLTEDGFSAKPYHGKMDKEDKTANQNAFMSGEVKIIVATSAFGMGVDKDNVGMVIHYNISDSLENYIQEAGRAGRDENMLAECYILFNEEDLDWHFSLLNQTKISAKEINQIWKGIKELTRTRNKISHSALEIARKAGWDEEIHEIETRVTTAIAALEDAKYIKRGQNSPRVFANSILTKNAGEAIARINASGRLEDKQKLDAIRIISKLFSSKSKRLATEEIAESRVDYIADQLGMENDEVIRIITLLKEEKILADTKDLTAFIKKGDPSNRSLAIVENYGKLERFLLSELKEEESVWHLKELNEASAQQGVKEGSPHKIKIIINFWGIKKWIKRTHLDNTKNYIRIGCAIPRHEFLNKLDKRLLLAKLITEYLFRKLSEVQPADASAEEALIDFSVQELKQVVESAGGLFKTVVSIDDVEDTLFYLSRIEAIKIEGGFLVAYNRISIERLEKNNRTKYKESDYEKLRQFYQHKVQQIHIVGEYAKKMSRNNAEALQYVDDYFNLSFTSFLNRYFPGERQEEIKRTLTPEKFAKLFGELSTAQLEIIKDTQNPYIVVAAGPGSGKTKILVHKLASLLLAEDVKHEQLLMLTFSRAAVTEFKKQLFDLIGNAANRVDIKTFHSYCFDLLGRVGNLQQADTVIQQAVEKIRSRDIETSGITKTVLVVDEAQDMNADEYELVKVLMEENEEMRVILVGDDDQNIYQFRGSDSRFMQQFLTERNAVKYELIENYRSRSNIIHFANQWAAQISVRLKTEPGIARRQEDGVIVLTEYRSANLILPLVESIRQENLVGSTCLLTQTNEEAIQIAGLLRNKKINARLIQTNEGFRLDDLYELRLFSESLDLLNGTSPLIDEEDWQDAIRHITAAGKESATMDLAMAVIRDFESTSQGRKYKSDWNTFLRESRMEDFVRIDSTTIYVTTIHKAKGKEFDNVVILLNGYRPESDEKKRLLYVAMTRAKNNLSIHYNGNYLRHLTAQNLQRLQDNKDYPEPQQLALALTHRDIHLGFFASVQHEINDLGSGSLLYIQEDGLADSKGKVILRFSQNFKERLTERGNKGYRLSGAKVNFIVYWKGADMDKEIKIVLPELILQKGPLSPPHFE